MPQSLPPGPRTRLAIQQRNSHLFITYLSLSVCLTIIFYLAPLPYTHLPPYTYTIYPYVPSHLIKTLRPRVPASYAHLPSLDAPLAASSLFIICFAIAVKKTSPSCQLDVLGCNASRAINHTLTLYHKLHVPHPIPRHTKYKYIFGV